MKTFFFSVCSTFTKLHFERRRKRKKPVTMELGGAAIQESRSQVSIREKTSWSDSQYKLSQVKEHIWIGTCQKSNIWVGWLVLSIICYVVLLSRD